MKYLKCFYVFALIVLALSLEQSIADVTSSNATSNNTSTTGSNTAIHGYEATTNYNSGSNPVTNNTTTNSTSNNSKTASAPANAPSTQIYSSQSCTIAYSGAISTVTFGLAGSGYFHDPYCERRMLAQVLNKFGLKVGALSLLCQDPNVRKALYDAGSYCPIHSNGKAVVGLAAKAEWDKLNADVTDDVNQYRQYKESLKQ